MIVGGCEYLKIPRIAGNYCTAWNRYLLAAWGVLNQLSDDDLGECSGLIRVY